MAKQSKPEWKKLLPKSKKEQNEIFRKSMMYSSSMWEKYVDSKEDAVKFTKEILSLVERKGLDVDVSFAVILELANKKLGENKGVELLKEVLIEVLERNNNS